VFLRDERLVLAANLRYAKIRGALLSIEHALEAAFIPLLGWEMV
jgi:hypothetical protein